MLQYRNRVILTFSLIFSGAYLFAQCATEVPRSHKLSPPIFSSQSKSLIEYNLNKTLSVNIFVVASEFNTYDFGYDDYSAAWEELNLVFEPIGMSFELCNETQIPNYNYNILSNIPEPGTVTDEEDEMLAQHYTPNLINVYYVETIINEPPAEGYAYFPGGPDVIVLEKSSDEFTLIHEMGHFFGLYHTFETELGMELVNGSNCESTGDLVCDTPADDNGNVDGCQYADLSNDSNGDLYTPYINNYMSYYPADCKCEFTPGQYNRMSWIYMNERNYLW